MTKIKTDSVTVIRDTDESWSAIMTEYFGYQRTPNDGTKTPEEVSEESGGKITAAVARVMLNKAWKDGKMEKIQFRLPGKFKAKNCYRPIVVSLSVGKKSKSG